MNSILKEMLKELVLDFGMVQLTVKRSVCQFLIYIPWEERQEFKNKEFLKEVSQQSSYVGFDLPVIPRLGEEIEIPFIQETGNFYRGHVHEIKHKITGNTQEIMIYVHPWDDYYYKWVKMKEEFERRKSWR